MGTMPVADMRAQIKQAQSRLDSFAGTKVPGLQYIVMKESGPFFEYAGGWADIHNRVTMTPDTTMMAYSMTKTFTAVAVLQLVEQGKLGLDDEVDRYLPETPYRDHHLTIRQLLAHTAGLPNPIPLRWAHLTEEAAGFDEDAALAQVLRKHARLKSAPGAKFAYSNIGYWLLGKIIEQVAEQPYVDYVRANLLQPLGIPPAEMDFVIPDQSRHANGYLARYSLTNLLKGIFTDKKFWGEYEGNWLHLKSHHLNGPAFGGLVGTARSFGRFLQDQLRPESVLFNAETRPLLQTPQRDTRGNPIPMTLGWHVGSTSTGNTSTGNLKEPVSYLFKEGGGGGFHSEMRLYTGQGIGTVVIVNSTEFNSRKFLNNLDPFFWQ